MLEGFNGTIIAYGQTSAGKKYSMQGPSMIFESMMGAEIIPEAGILQRTVKQIFSKIHDAPSNMEFSIKISILEIYCEKIKDLITPTNSESLKIKQDKEDGIYVEGLSEIYVRETINVYLIMKKAYENRTVGETNMNDKSS